MNFLRTTFCLLPLMAIPSAAMAAGPSFDCDKAETPVEKAICGNDKLSELDQIMARGCSATKSSLGSEMANKLHKPFLRMRNSCGADEFCILQSGLAEIDQFQTLETVGELPDWIKLSGHATYNSMKSSFRPGECTVSRVREVATRLCSDDETGYCAPAEGSGSSLLLDNGMYGVSYDQIEAVDKAKPGDLVTACLVSVPEDCPEGDDRGYQWSYSFKRTSQTATLPDAQHMCGGA